MAPHSNWFCHVTAARVSISIIKKLVPVGINSGHEVFNPLF